MGYLPICLFLIQSFINILESQSTFLLPPQQNLFLKYFIVFDVINRIFSLFSRYFIVSVQKHNDFHMLNLYAPTFLYLLVIKGFWWSLQDFSICKTMPYANRDNFIPSFLIWMPLISFSCLAVPATVLKCGSGYPFLVPDLKGKTVFYH